MWSDPQGVEYNLPAINPQSFGADAPPTGGYNKSDLLAEVLSHPIYQIRQPRKRAIRLSDLSYEIKGTLSKKQYFFSKAQIYYVPLLGNSISY